MVETLLVGAELQLPNRAETTKERSPFRSSDDDTNAEKLLPGLNALSLATTASFVCLPSVST